MAETKKAHSVWQRCPSYRAKLEAELQSDGSPVYHVMFAQPGAGMQSMVTESVLAAGNGEYVLALEVRAEPAEGESSPVPLRAQLLSNETCNSATAKVGREWQRLELKLKAEFKKPETGLVSIFLNFPKGAARQSACDHSCNNLSGVLQTAYVNKNPDVYIHPEIFYHKLHLIATVISP